MNVQLPRSNRPSVPTIVGQDEREFYGFGNLPPQFEGSQDHLRASLVNYIALAVKRKYLLTVILGIFLLGGLIITLNTPRIYNASTTIRIERSAPRVIRDQLAQPDSAEGEDTQFYETQFELIRSRLLADRVATALNLEHTDFLEAPPTSFVDRLNDHLGPWQSSLLRRLRDAQPSFPSWLTHFLIPAQPSLQSGAMGSKAAVATDLDANADKARHERAVSQILDGLSVKPIGNSSIVRISYAGVSPAWAQRISIAVAEQFEKMTLDMRFSASLYARNFLEEQLQGLKHKLEASERQLIDYAHREGILDVDSKQPQVLTEIATVQNAYAAAATARLTLEETWRQAQGDGVDALPQTMGDTRIQAARAKLAELRATNSRSAHRCGTRLSCSFSTASPNKRD